MKFILDGTAEIVLQPARYQILKLLQSSDKPLFVEQIANETKIHPRMVSHHLDVLQDQGLITSEYVVSNVEGSKRGVAVRLCKATPHSKEVLKSIKESM